jgi:hypothetical protein
MRRVRYVFATIYERNVYITDKRKLRKKFQFGKKIRESGIASLIVI